MRPRAFPLREPELPVEQARQDSNLLPPVLEPIPHWSVRQNELLLLFILHR
jgi:hypothetical protein